MDIRQTFLNLTNKTYPHGMEHLLEKYLPKDIMKDRFGNYFYLIGESRVIFASHLDTVSNTYQDVNHVFSEDGNIVKTDGTTTLGADDKAGVTIMLYMIENKIPGLYYFFVGEEVGCIGSGKVSGEDHIFNSDHYDKVISFDRRGNGSIITHQSSKRCCSDEFANSLIDELNETGLVSMSKDDGGVCTDSLQFIDTISECTNVSVGYKNEHTGNEFQDLEFLENISKACIKVDWETLPTKRDYTKTEYKSYSYHGYEEYEEYDYGNYGSSIDRAYGYNQNPFDNIQSDSDSHGPPWRNNIEINHRSDEFSYLNDILDGGYSDLSRHRNGEFDLSDDDNDDIYDFDNVISSSDFFDNILERDEKKSYLDMLKDKFLDDSLTVEEIRIIKEQFLDMNDEMDREFYNNIEQLVNLKESGVW